MNTSKEAWMEIIQAGDVLLQEMLNPTLRSQISAPPMPRGIVTHWQHPFAPLPTTCTPEMMSLLHPRCLRMENWSYLSLSCKSQSPRTSLQRWCPWNPRSCRVLQPTLLTKWWQSASHISFKSSNYGISCTSAGNKTPDWGSFLGNVGTRRFWPHKPCYRSLCFA